MISVSLLSKQFGEKIALDNLNLNISKGEFYCLLGPNGAGKTTTLKLLTGLIKASSGRISIGGFDVATESLLAKSILGFIPDTPFIYENLTAIEFLEFIGDIFKIDRDVLSKKMEYYFDLFDLGEAKNALLCNYSHGMRQKVIYIANFIHDPKVLLVDEPLVGLDPQAIRLIKNIFKEKVREGMTILMCTHILQIAEELADRVGILQKGKLIIEGTIPQLREKISQDSLENIFLKLTTDNN